MYYHIRIDYYDTKLKANQTVFDYNITDLGSLKSDVIIPYIHDKVFMFTGIKINSNESKIRKLRIYESEQTIEDCRHEVYSQIPSNVIIAYSNEDILEKGGYVKDITRIINDIQKDLINFSDSKSESNDSRRHFETNKVFVVHGHDTNIRNEVELFVRSIGYEPIILCKRVDMGNTIIEKIEREAKDVCYAIVIYTSCDLGKDKNGAELKPRARQNVVFEHGFMCAHLGRSHVCALLEEGVEQPGDLKGVIYKPLDAAGAWKYLIADEMKAVGLEVDKNIIK